MKWHEWLMSPNNGVPPMAGPTHRVNPHQKHRKVRGWVAARDPLRGEFRNSHASGIVGMLLPSGQLPRARLGRQFAKLKINVAVRVMAQIGCVDFRKVHCWQRFVMAITGVAEVGHDIQCSRVRHGRRGLATGHPVVANGHPWTRIAPALLLESGNQRTQGLDVQPCQMRHQNARVNAALSLGAALQVVRSCNGGRLAGDQTPATCCPIFGASQWRATSHETPQIHPRWPAT